MQIQTNETRRTHHTQSTRQSLFQPQTTGKYLLSLFFLHLYLHSCNAIPPHRPEPEQTEQTRLGKKTTPRDGAGPLTRAKLRRTAAASKINCNVLKRKPPPSNGKRHTSLSP